MRIALLEDDATYSAYLSLLMIEAGHSTAEFSTGQAILAELKKSSFDLLLLDWGLPDVSGIDVLKWARENLEPFPPVVMLTGRVAACDVIDGLRHGADDYLAKTARDDVLKARIEAVLRRARGRKPAVTEVFGHHSFDLTAAVVSIDGVPTVTTAKEFDLALMLFRNLNRSLSRADIVEAAWRYLPAANSRTLDAHISSVRKKLRLGPELGLRLTAVYAFGYRLDNDVSSAPVECPPIAPRYRAGPGEGRQTREAAPYQGSSAASGRVRLG